MKSILIFLVVFCAAQAHSQTPSPDSTSPAQPVATEPVFILGEIRQPQILAHTTDLSLSAAIGNAGGTSDFGFTRIYIIRDGAIFLKTTTREVFLKASSVDPKLKPKDIVYLGTIGNAQ